ncbi:hypothetical protein QO259_17065 [Salinicola sp. JS01]|uniref:hypothetical protein n=1 Tax=Salinicola sp. JS01 TaxID=3050071 RepID=UPI00255B61E6|nr:hypothetical protein [Salinicola sp. JS01]WIX32499.1 hypothetical protein QO259_17065 [Salinicola sp. JS01]
MAEIKIHAGDYKGLHGNFSWGVFSFSQPHHTFKREARYEASDIEAVELANEENVKRLGGTIGWGAAGAVILGPVGLLAGLLAGGRSKQVTFVAKFTDGKKILATTDSKTWTKIQAATF